MLCRTVESSSVVLSKVIYAALLLGLVLLSILFPAILSTASALPLNTDMFDTQPGKGQIMRPLPEDTVPIGSLGLQFESREDAAQLENPVAPDASSLASGKRLFSINCTPCHGSYEGGYQPGEIARFGMPPINLAEERLKAMSDAYFFQFIHFGGLALMPAYGWKFSMEEHWDIVNYIRQIQNEEY